MKGATVPLLERSDNARISWEVDGPDDGQAVLLIMGLAYPAAMWFRLMPALTERYRVIRVDNRGAGHTGDVPGAPYTVETMAADCLAVLDAAEVMTAHVVGISMGGLMAQEIALAAPERVRSLCLLATHPGIAHAVMNPEAMTILGKRGELTPQEAAEASVPFNYAPSTPRERIEEDWAVRLPLAATNEGYLAQASGTSQWDGYDPPRSNHLPDVGGARRARRARPTGERPHPRRSHSRSRARHRPAGEPPPRHRPAGAGLRVTHQLAGSLPLNPGRRALRNASGRVPVWRVAQRHQGQ